MEDLLYQNPHCAFLWLQSLGYEDWSAGICPRTFGQWLFKDKARNRAYVNAKFREGKLVVTYIRVGKCEVQESCYVGGIGRTDTETLPKGC